MVHFSKKSGSEKRGKNLRKKLFAVVAVSAMVCAGYFLAGQISKKNEIEAEIEKLESEAMKIEKENNLLRDRISYFESRDFAEKEAKEKLNMQKPDENVVVVKTKIIPEKMEEKEPESIEEKIPIAEVSNVIKWWNYFFSHEN